jgi:hypothetical protein
MIGSYFSNTPLEVLFCEEPKREVRRVTKGQFYVGLPPDEGIATITLEERNKVIAHLDVSGIVTMLLKNRGGSPHIESIQ